MGHFDVGSYTHFDGMFGFEEAADRGKALGSLPMKVSLTVSSLGLWASFELKAAIRDSRVDANGVPDLLNDGLGIGRVMDSDAPTSGSSGCVRARFWGLQV